MPRVQFPYVDFELFKDIIRQGKELGMSSVKLTGGEPLIHPEIGRLRVSNMTGSGLPQRGVERCSNCDVCLVACAFSANSASTSEQDNEKFQ